MDYDALVIGMDTDSNLSNSQAPTPNSLQTTGKPPWKTRLNQAFDHWMTHPITEAGKMVARFVPGVAIFMLGVDRLTRWKLIYSKNEPLVSQLERKMTDLATIYIALVEILQPHLNKEKHPQLELFAKKANQIKQLIHVIQTQIEQFQSKSEKAKLGLAETIHSQFLNLQQILDELQRDVVLHLSIQSVNQLQKKELTLDHILSILSQQKQVLESHTSTLNPMLMTILDRQIQSHEYMNLCLKQLKEDHTPGYAKVDHLEIRKLWFDFFRWPAVIPMSKFLDEMPLYFEMHQDKVAFKLWNQMRVQPKDPNASFFSFDDIGLALKNTDTITAYALSHIFPFDPVYEVKIGDWIIWTSLGWLFLVYEINKQYLSLNGKGFFLFPTLISKFLAFISNLVLTTCSIYDYQPTLHERLTRISIYIRGCTSFTPFADRFSFFILCLQESYLKLEDLTKFHHWPDELETNHCVTAFITYQKQLSQLAHFILKSNSIQPWTNEEIDTLIKEEVEMSKRAHRLGTFVANKVCHGWNGQFLIPTTLFSSPVQKLGSKTWKVHFFHSPVALKSLEGYSEPLDFMVKKMAYLSTLKLCPHLISLYGITFFQGQCCAVLEYCQFGTLPSFLHQFSTPSSLNHTSESSSNDFLSQKLDFCCQLIDALFFLNRMNLGIEEVVPLSKIYVTSGHQCKLDSLALIRFNTKSLFTSPFQPNEKRILGKLQTKPSELIPRCLGPLCIEILANVSTTDFTNELSSSSSSVSEQIWTQQFQQLPKDLIQFLVQLMVPLLDPSSATSQSTLTLAQVYDFFKTYSSTYSNFVFSSSSSSSSSLSMVPTSFPDLVSGPTSSNVLALAHALFDFNESLSLIRTKLFHLSTTDPLALLYLGDLYYYDFQSREGGKELQDFHEAKKWYQLAIQHHIGWGHVGLADFAYFGLSDVPKDAFVAELGYSAGLTQVYSEVIPQTIARMYAGLGDVHYDATTYPKAWEYYQQAIQYDAQCHRAWARLGDMYLLGRVVHQDWMEAEKCYLKCIQTKRGIEGMLALSKLRNDVASIQRYSTHELLKSLDF